MSKKVSLLSWHWKSMDCKNLEENCRKKSVISLRLCLKCVLLHPLSGTEAAVLGCFEKNLPESLELKGKICYLCVRFPAKKDRVRQEFYDRLINNDTVVQGARGRRPHVGPASREKPSIPLGVFCDCAGKDINNIRTMKSLILAQDER